MYGNVIFGSHNACTLKVVHYIKLSATIKYVSIKHGDICKCVGMTYLGLYKTVLDDLHFYVTLSLVPIHHHGCYISQE